MAGGTWTTQNKVRPGVYINFNSEPKPVGLVGDRGIMTMALPLSWGEAKKVISIEAGTNLPEVLGYDITEPSMLLVREALKRAKTVLLYRLNEGVKATAEHEELIVTARHGGVRGNDISIVIQEHIDSIEQFEVKTLVAGKEVDVQLVADVSELQPNSWVAFSGSGLPVPTAGITLAGGADGSVTNADHMDYLGAIEVFSFQTMAVVSEDSSLKSVYSSFVKRQRNQEGNKIQAVMANYPEADDEGVISVRNGVVLSDGTVLNSVQSTVWVAAATAAAQVNESLTYRAYDDAIDVDIRYAHSEIESALTNGEFVFVQNNGRAIVEQDINTFRSFTPTKGKSFAKNRVIRVLDGIGQDYKRIFETFYIGKVDNNADGRNLFLNECIDYLKQYQALGAIQNLDSQNDVTVEPGTDAESLYVEVNVQPVDSIEKIYMKVQVQ